MDIIGLSGYALASLAYLVFSLLLFAARNQSIIAIWLLFCSLVAMVSNLVASLQIKLGFSLQWPMLLSAINIAVWSILILSSNSQLTTLKSLFNDKYVRLYSLVWLLVTSVCWLLSYFSDSGSQYLFLLFVLLNLTCLVLIEQLYRSANSQTRWAIWPLVVALASITIFDFVLYAQASMVEHIDFDFWYSRGFIAAFIMPLLLISTRRIRNGDVRIFVSRQVVFYSSMLMIAGVYLLIMALAGYVINYIGGEWGSLISVTFLMLASVALITLLITETLRKKVKVFITKNFFANKYEYRDEWLDLIEKIETTDTKNHYQVATDIMMSKLDVESAALVKRVNDQHYQVQYNSGIDIDHALEQELIIAGLFCQQKGWIIDVNEYIRTPSLYQNLPLTPAVFQRKKLQIIVPIFINSDFYGLFLFSHGQQPHKLNWEDRDLLFAVSKQLGNFISLHEANEKLAESKQFDAFNRMSAFLVHDLKNVQAQLALITANAKKHRQNPEFIDDVFDTVESATERLDKMLKQLGNKQLAQSTSKNIDLSKIIDKVVEQCNIRLPRVTVGVAEQCITQIDDETFHSILNHLLQNAQEATTNDDGWVKISLSRQQQQVKVTISDNGCGMSQEFIENRLFKPFDTTKGNAGMGIGVYEAKQFIESLSGTLEVTSTEHQGSTFTLTFPLSPANEATI